MASTALDGLAKGLNRTLLEYCKAYGTDVVTFVGYRSLQIVWIFVAGIAIFNVLRVYLRYIRASKLHINIQIFETTKAIFEKKEKLRWIEKKLYKDHQDILLTLFMFSAVLINTTFIIAQTYQFILSFAFHQPCDVFLNRTFYTIFNISYGFFTELYLLSKATMTIERSLATIYVSSYEHMKCLPGGLGVIISIVLATGVELYIYMGASFEQQHITITSTSSDVSGRINRVLFFNVSCCAITVIIMIILLLVNVKRKKNAIGCVSHRFQIEENIATTNFIAKIAFVQLVAFSIQSLGGLLVRLYSKYLFDADDIPAMKSLKMALHVMPLFTVIMSVVIELSIRGTARHHHSRLLKMVNVKNSAKLNSQFLELQWSQSEPKWPRFDINNVVNNNPRRVNN